MALSGLLAGSGRAQEPIWRPLALGEASTARLTAEVQRALAARFRLDPGALAVELLAPRLETDGARVHLFVPQGRVRLDGVDAWGLEVHGEVGFADLSLDYRGLIAGDLSLLARPVLRPAIRLRQGALEEYMASKGILDASFGASPDGQSLELGGAYRLRFLFLHMRPEVRVRGRLEFSGARAGFVIQDVELRRVPRMVRGLLRRFVDRAAAKGIFTELDLSDVHLAGGGLQVVDAAGATLYRQPIAGGPVAAE
jgi:hypothetical protein